MSSSEVDTRDEILLNDDAPKRVDGIGLHDLSLKEHSDLTRLAEIIAVPGQRTLVLRRNRHHRIGRVRVRDLVVTVPPPMPADLFVDMYLYAAGGDLLSFAERRTAPVDLRRSLRGDVFLQLLAYLLVGATERLLTRHIARAYVQTTGRGLVVRGRPVWTKDFGRHPVDGITCRYHVQVTDNLLNRLVLAGLKSASRILRDTPWISHASNQVFIWRSVAEDAYPRLADFAAADARINRLTEHYRPVLNLARAVTMGFAPEDPFSGSSSALQVLEFSLPLLFEKFLYRLLTGYAARLGVGVRFKETDPAALVDGFGDNYRNVEPDIVMYVGDRPAAVIDAKYKPRYLRGLDQQPIKHANRVTNADLYQLFFYQSRLQRSAGLATPPFAGIVVPQLPEGQPLPCSERRSVVWQSNGTDDVGVVVLPLPLASVIRRLREGADEVAALEVAPELMSTVGTWFPALRPRPAPERLVAQAPPPAS